MSSRRSRKGCRWMITELRRSNSPLRVPPAVVRLDSSRVVDTSRGRRITATVSPTRSKVESSSDRASASCAPAARSPISSSTMVPPTARPSTGASPPPPPTGHAGADLALEVLGAGHRALLLRSHTPGTPSSPARRRQRRKNRDADPRRNPLCPVEGSAGRATGVRREPSPPGSTAARCGPVNVGPIGARLNELFNRRSSSADL